MAHTERGAAAWRVGFALLFSVLAAGCAARSVAPAPEPAQEQAPEPRLRTFLMFEGRASEALEFYTGLFPAARVVNIERFAPGEMGPEGTIKLARFELFGQELLCFDSPAPHPFTFTPAISFFVTCADEAEQERLFAALSADGLVLMPLGDYGFSRRFAWVADRFGVTWQLNLP